MLIPRSTSRRPKNPKPAATLAATKAFLGSLVICTTLIPAKVAKKLKPASIHALIIESFKGVLLCLYFLVFVVLDMLMNVNASFNLK